MDIATLDHICALSRLNFTEDEQKEMLDDIHKRKIDMADAIYVINKDGYIGSSTKSEIAYAKEHGKGVYYMEEME
jgi:hypothetical protein